MSNCLMCDRPATIGLGPNGEGTKFFCSDRCAMAKAFGSVTRGLSWDDVPGCSTDETPASDAGDPVDT